MDVVQNLEEQQFTVYSAAVAIVKTLGLRSHPQGDVEGRTRPSTQKSTWVRRLENRITTLRTKTNTVHAWEPINEASL